MLRFLGFMFIVTLSFASGYYWGQRPIGTLEQTIADLQRSLKELSRNVLDTTLGIERDLRWRQHLVDAKAKVVEARADLLERNYGDAARELEKAIEAIEALEGASKSGPSDESHRALREVASSLREVRMQATMGKPVPRKKVDELLHRLDHLLNK